MTTTETAAPYVLEAEDVAVHYGGIKAVDGFGLRLPPGKIYGILGPNGSGKSTFLAAVTRLVPLTRGRLLLDGKEYHNEPPMKLARKGLARTFQTVRLLPELTVLQNVQLGADINDPRGRLRSWLGRDRPTEAVEEAIERTGLGDVRDAWPTELSYGMARRVEIARALAARPRLLLLDEPTAGMNHSERREISELMQKLRDEGLAQLIVEHDVQMMVDTCDHLVAMNFGSLVAEGKPQEVVSHPAVQEAYLGKRWGAMLEIRDLHVSYGKIEAVRGVSASAAPGKITLVLGANGAGKTTTLRAAMGLLPVRSGEVLLDGKPITGRPTHRIVRDGLVLVPEGRQVFAPLTVEENLILGGYTASKEQAAETMEQVYEMFPILKERRNGPAGLLSGGEQQMLAFGRALMSSPRAMMLDEPSMGLAPTMVESVLSTVRSIADSGIALLMVEQNAEMGLEIADDVVVVARGEVVFSGPAEQARRNSSVVRAFLGEAALSS